MEKPMNQQAEADFGAVISLDSAALDCKDPDAMATFYQKMLGWERHFVWENNWVDICPPGGGVKIGFQRNDIYVPPVWPEEPEKQQQMAHLDFVLKDREELQRAVQHALACGATLTQAQYGDGKWVTMLDPAGHPFCFVTW